MIGAQLEKQRSPLSYRRSMLVWVAGGVVGWSVAIVALYAMLRLGIG